MKRPAFKLRRLSAISRKEALQIFRDPSTLLVAFVLPIVMLFLFAYATSVFASPRRAHLAALIARFKAGLTLARWQLLPSDTPIQPLVIGDNHEALAVSRALDAEGLWVPAIRPPTVPKGAARLRITLSAAHSFEQVERLVATLKRLEAHHP